MLLLIDNYDSFTYNIVHAFEILGQKVIVIRRHAFCFSLLKKLSVQFLVIGPGPGSPYQIDKMQTLIKNCPSTIPLLGVCLGHQCIGIAFGGSVIKATHVVHGKQSIIHSQKKGLFTNLPKTNKMTRYHSLLIENESFPSCLNITAVTKLGEIMAIEHRERPIFGLQFHPESVQSKKGPLLLEAFLQTPLIKTH